MKSVLFTFLMSLMFFSSVSPMTYLPRGECRWNPTGSALCRGRNFCFISASHPKCQRYCQAFPYDNVCYR